MNQTPNPNLIRTFQHINTFIANRYPNSKTTNVQNSFAQKTADCVETPKSKAVDPKGNSLSTELILRLISVTYGVHHVHIHHKRERVFKLVPAKDEYGELLYFNGNLLYSHQQQYKGKGGHTFASVMLPSGTRIEAVAITHNQSKFVKKIGYNEAVYNLWKLLDGPRIPVTKSK